jgi:stage V sporulation protein S
VLRERPSVELQAVGAGAINQAVKAIAIARSYLAGQMDVSCVPSFIDVQIDGNERTGISLRIERHLQGDDPR